MTEQTPLEGLYARESAPQGAGGELEGVGRERPSGGREEPQRYPYNDGDITVLGPEIFASKGGAVICWRGENYIRQQDIPPRGDEMIVDALHELASGVRDLASSVRLENSDRARGEVSTDSERCCGCGSGPVVYRNFEDNPFCAHCANCPCGQIPCVRPEQQPAHNAGPTVAECVEADRAYWERKDAGEGS